MEQKRRLIPSTSALAAFESVARNLSFTKAAQDLSLTQSAVSRQVQALELQLGRRLIDRSGRQIRLTDAGQSYAREISKALMTIRDASLELVSESRNQELNLAILPTFGTRWLMPRISKFVSRHPEITLNFATKIARFDFAAENVDAAIYHGRPDWPGVDCTFLMQETIVPVAAPALVPKGKDTLPRDLIALPRLSMKSRPDAWTRWCAANGLEAPSDTGMQFEHFSTLAQACAAGMGVALMPEFLVRGELDRQDIVAVGDPSINEEAYFYAVPAFGNRKRAALLFGRWLANEAKGQPEGLSHVG